MAETTALDFKYGLKQREDKSVKLNVYELGGGRVLSNLLSTVFVGNSIDNIIIVICIDLSKPGNSIDNLAFWLKAVRDQSMSIVNELKACDPASLLGVQKRLKSVWADHEDKQKVKAFPVPVVIVGTKYDVFANTYESKLKKILCDALRYLAHTTGSDLVFASVREQQPAKVFLSHLSNLIYEGDATTIDTNSNNPIQITSGADRLSKINEPDGAGRSKASLEELYQQAIETNF